MKPKEKSLLLSVNEKKPLNTRIVESTILFVGFYFLIPFVSIPSVSGGISLAGIVVLIGGPLLNFFFFSRYRFELNEEGVKLKPLFGIHYFYRWDSFRSYTADHVKKRFVLKGIALLFVLKGKGVIELDSTEKFDEIERILSERIPSSVTR